VAQWCRRAGRKLLHDNVAGVTAAKLIATRIVGDIALCAVGGLANVSYVAELFDILVAGPVGADTIVQLPTGGRGSAAATASTPAAAPAAPGPRLARGEPGKMVSGVMQGLPSIQGSRPAVPHAFSQI